MNNIIKKLDILKFLFLKYFNKNYYFVILGIMIYNI